MLCGPYLPGYYCSAALDAQPQSSQTYYVVNGLGYCTLKPRLSKQADVSQASQGYGAKLCLKK